MWDTESRGGAEWVMQHGMVSELWSQGEQSGRGRVSMVGGWGKVIQWE